MKEFFDDLNRLAQPRRIDIIEKDYHLHRLLHSISQNEYLSNKLVFKGGTCLVKAYTGYYRFSEDIDFTWKDKSIWQDNSPSQTRKQCSREISTIIEHLIPMAEDLDMNFTGNKSDMNEVIIGAGGRMSRFYLSYISDTLDRPAKIKMEINFVDKTFFPFQTKQLNSYIQEIESKKLQFIYADAYEKYTLPITIDCYDLREIYTEKVRAALTRIKYKLRDIIDIHILQQKYGYTISDYRDPIIEKTKFILDIYRKYKETIDIKALPAAEDIPQEELALLITDPPKDIEENIERIHEEIQTIQLSII